MNSMILCAIAVATLAASFRAEGQENPNDVRSKLDKNTAGPRIDVGNIRISDDAPALTLVKDMKPRFDIRKQDEIIEIDGKAVDPIEGAARVHSDDTKMGTVTVKRAGKKIVLKATAPKKR